MYLALHLEFILAEPPHYEIHRQYEHNDRHHY